VPALLFSYEGRIGVKQFWLGLLTGLASTIALSVLVGIVIGIGTILMGASVEQQQGFVLAGTVLVMGYAVYTQLAVTVKRCHDQGRSGWWCLLMLVPFVGLAWLVLDLGTQRGTPSQDQ
jgi:uncharacterized membrane protein YhaH (DUF805 family)